MEISSVQDSRRVCGIEITGVNWSRLHTFKTLLEKSAKVKFHILIIHLKIIPIILTLTLYLFYMCILKLNDTTRSY